MLVAGVIWRLVVVAVWCWWLFGVVWCLVGTVFGDEVGGGCLDLVMGVGVWCWCAWRCRCLFGVGKVYGNTERCIETGI